MTKQEKKKYESTEVLKREIEGLRGRKFRLDCGHFATFNHHLANNIILLNGKHLKIICSLCGY